MINVACKDGTSVRDIVSEWLRANHYDGLCNPDSECGCDLADLMPCQCVNDRDCVCAYRIVEYDGAGEEVLLCTSNSGQDEPSDALCRIGVDVG